MVDARGEVDLGGLEGIVCGEVDGEEEDTAGIWGVALFKPVSRTSPSQVASHPVPQPKPSSRSTVCANTGSKQTSWPKQELAEHGLTERMDKEVNLQDP